MFAATVILAFIILQAGQAPVHPPRDLAPVRSSTAIDSMTREAELQKQIAASPNGAAAYIELAKLQEDRGAFADAELTLSRVRQAAPANKAVLSAIAAFYNRQGDFAKTVDALEALERLDPSDPSAPQITATFYWEKAFKDQRLLPAEKYTYLMSGIAATDRALALKPDYMEALTYKNLLLRLRANLETDPVQKQQLIAEADALRARAIELNKQRAGINSSGQSVALGPMPPPPPPPPPSQGMAAPNSPMGTAPVRVGGNIKTPTKVRDVRPMYPPDAQAAGVQGVVIIEATIDPDGRVSSGRILRSIPPLDDAALAAVRQWEFTPTYLNGAPVPVIMTVTVNFTLQN
jgi:TonB family protein